MSPNIRKGSTHFWSLSRRTSEISDPRVRGIFTFDRSLTTVLCNPNTRHYEADSLNVTQRVQFVTIWKVHNYITSCQVAMFQSSYAVTTATSTDALNVLFNVHSIHSDDASASTSAGDSSTLAGQLQCS
jgi:hypothetical protein